MKKVIICNETTDYSDYYFGVISLETGKPIEWIHLNCCGESFETSYFIEELKRNNLYSEYMEKPSDIINGKRPADIEDWNWFGSIVSKVVLEGIKANRDYEILYTYGMEYGDGYNNIINLDNEEK